MGGPKSIENLADIDSGEDATAFMVKPYLNADSTWQHDGERGSLGGLALHVDRALVIGHRVFDDGETEACAAGLLRSAFLHSIEALENLRLFVFGDADARIAYFDDDVADVLF